MRRFFRQHFLTIELLLALGVGGALACWGEADQWRALDPVMRRNGSAFYTATAAIIGSLLGFTISAITLLLAFSESPALALLASSKKYPELWKVFLSSIRWLGIGTAYSLATIMLDGEGPLRHWLFYGSVTVLLVCGARVARAIWVLENVTALVIGQRNSASAVPPPAAST
jgi:hypothetical protein